MKGYGWSGSDWECVCVCVTLSPAEPPTGLKMEQGRQQSLTMLQGLNQQHPAQEG